MSDPSSEFGSDRQWDHGWAGHEEAQMLRLAKLSFREKLAWLDEAHRMVLHMQADAARRQTDSPEKT